MPSLERIGFFDQGPYSFHLTAGPDRDKPGDGLGMDIRNNPVMQRWVHVIEQHGSTIGDHGGWIHNYFGLNVNEDNEAEFEKYLELNNQALEAVTGHPIREYSAPVGTHPKWVTHWLEAHGFLAYYFTGDTGMAPTKVYRDGTRTDHTIWAFPICNLGKAASLEDMHFSGVPEAEVGAWLRGMSEFVTHQRVSRLVYAHPPCASFYPALMAGEDERTQAERHFPLVHHVRIGGVPDAPPTGAVADDQTWREIRDRYPRHTSGITGTPDVVPAKKCLPTPPCARRQSYS
jgi:hypothetical protein